MAISIPPEDESRILFYVTPIGRGDKPHILGKQFYVMYTYYPNNGEGWGGASVRRFTVTCR
jgi:hypothetical protein